MKESNSTHQVQRRMTQVKTLIIGCVVLALAGCSLEGITLGDWSPPVGTNFMTPTTGFINGSMSTMNGMPGDTLTLSVVLKTRSKQKVIANALVEWRVVDPRGQGSEGLAYSLTPSTKTNAAGTATTRLVIIGHFADLQAIAHSNDAPDITFTLRPTYLQ